MGVLTAKEITLSATIERNRKLLEGQMMLAEVRRQEMIVCPEHGTTLEEMNRPGYWANVAKQLKPLDRIEVRPADGTWWAELLVRAVEPFSVLMMVMRTADLSTGSTGEVSEIPDGYEVRHRGANGWSVIREEDRIVLTEKQPSREQAEAWLSAHLRRLAA